MFFMATTIRINEDVKQQLKIKCVELGVKQIDLINRYVIEGIERDNSSSKPNLKSIDELKKLLKHDNPNGTNFDSIAGIVTDPIEKEDISVRRVLR